MSGDAVRLFLLDGTYELFRAHYGAPSKILSDGREVGGTIGVVRSVLKLIRDHHVTHLACAFDHVIESFRNDLFEGYKSGEGIEPVILAQFGLVEKAVDSLGVVAWPMVKFEADDALASAAARFVDDPRVSQTVICTPDKDLAQCVRGSRVVCMDRRADQLIDADGVRAKFGVDPDSIPDFLGLVGDASDGIPGVKGWGKKSAATVLARYKHLEHIPVNHEDWDVQVRGAARLVANLSEDLENAILYRHLARLRTDVPLEEDLPDLEWSGVPRAQFEALADELEDSELTLAVPRWAG